MLSQSLLSSCTLMGLRGEKKEITQSAFFIITEATQLFSGCGMCVCVCVLGWVVTHLPLDISGKVYLVTFASGLCIRHLYLCLEICQAALWQCLLLKASWTVWNWTELSTLKVSKTLDRTVSGEDALHNSVALSSATPFTLQWAIISFTSILHKRL